MNYRIKSILAGAVISCSGYLQVQAVPLWDVNFDSMTAGVAPTFVATATAGVTNTSPTAVGTTAGGTTLVQENFTAGTAILAGNAAVLTKLNNTTGITFLRFYGHADDSVFTGNEDYEFSFDMLVSSTGYDTSRRSLQFNLAHNATDASFASVRLHTSGRIEYLIGGTTNITAAGVWDFDTVQRIGFVVDSQADEFYIKVDEVKVGSFSLASFTDAQKGIRDVRIGRADQNSTGFVAGIDNIYGGAVIPEPATLGMFIIGAVGAMLLRRL
jgi:hypothetical protein